jgi:predicted enzyme related to lactoylglutathione lyase
LSFGQYKPDLLSRFYGLRMAPTSTNGKICYLEIPASDTRRSTEFYQEVFGWQTRQRGDGALAFDDGVGAVSGTWVMGRAPSTPGLLVYIMVDSVASTIDSIIAHGGELVQPVGADSPEITARFRDPAGNVLGLYHEHAARAPTNNQPQRSSRVIRELRACGGC